jgi:hypothetical protein
MTGAGSLHANQTGWKFLKECEQLRAAQSLVENNIAILADAVDLKDVFGQIEANRCKLHQVASSTHVQIGNPQASQIAIWACENSFAVGNLTVRQQPRLGQVAKLSQVMGLCGMHHEGMSQIRRSWRP